MSWHLALAILLLTGCSCATPPRLDPQSAVDGNDVTALISGCGQQVGVGYLVCRMQEGDSAKTEQITVHAPPNVTCNNKNACTFFRIYFPDGRPTYEGKILKGQATAKVPLSEIVDKEFFEISDRGFYGISIDLRYIGPDGIDRKTYADGYLFIRVVKKEYTSLLENEEDENFNWIWKEKNQTIKMTSGFRVYVSPPFLTSSGGTKWRPLY